MTEVYITFGQIHVHSINGKTLDRDCVAAITCKTYDEGRALAMEWFDAKFHNSYSEDHFKDHKEEIMKWFSRGVIEVNPMNADEYSGEEETHS